MCPAAPVVTRNLRSRAWSTVSFTLSWLRPPALSPCRRFESVLSGFFVVVVGVVVLRYRALCEHPRSLPSQLTPVTLFRVHVERRKISCVARRCPHRNKRSTSSLYIPPVEMRKRTITSSASALLLLLAAVTSAKHSGVHEHLEALHKRHRASREVVARSTVENGEQGLEIRAVPETSIANASLEKRQGQCVFPAGEGLISVTPGSQNGGWAMSPNQPCTPGNYCPYACPPGQVSVQWDPSATSYSYPKSMVSGNLA